MSFCLASCHVPFFLSLLFVLHIYFSFWLCFAFTSTPNEDIVRFRCGDGDFLKKFEKIEKNLKTN